jgi:hypothetical protein
VKPKKEIESKDGTPSRRAFLGAVAAAAGSVTVAAAVDGDRPDPPAKRLLSARVRWIGHC